MFHPVVDHISITRYIKEYFHEHPLPAKEQKKTWDINKVLRYYKKGPENRYLPLNKLAKKAAMLILLSTMRRKNELLLLNLDKVSFKPHLARFTLTGLPKTYTLYHRVESLRFLTVRSYPKEPKICPLKALTCYMLKTRSVRATRQLFISNNPPYGKIAPMTLKRWILDVMTAAGVNTSVYGPYSTRHASSSAARAAGMPIDHIIQLAGWTSPSSFIIHYSLPIEHCENAGPHTQENQQLGLTHQDLPVFCSINIVKEC